MHIVHDNDKKKIMTKKNGEKSCFIRKKCVIFAKNKLFIKTIGL